MRVVPAMIGSKVVSFSLHTRPEEVSALVVVSRTQFATAHQKHTHPALPAGILVTLFSAFLLTYLALIPAPRVDGQLIGSDGFSYYAYARSMALDHDLNFANEFAYYGIPAPEGTPTVTGLVANKYSIGPALLWMPFFLIAHGLAWIGHALGLRVVPDGFGYLYQAAICVASIVYGALGFWLAFVCARRMFSPITASTAAALLLLGGNAVYYLVFEPSLSHPVAVFSLALLLTVWFVRFRERAVPSIGWAALLGVAGGIVLLIRPQNAVFILVPGVSLLLSIARSVKLRRSHETVSWITRGGLCVVTAAVVFTPQLFAWHEIYGSWTAVPYLSDHSPAFTWSHPHFLGVLVSTHHGLFSWNPIYLFSTVGLVLLGRRDARLALGLLAAVALETYIVAAWWSWWQGASFGGRMFIDASWVWVMGLAALLDRLRTSGARKVALGVATLLVIWNGLSLIQYRLGLLPMEDPPSWREMTIGRIELPMELWKRIRS